MLADSLEQHLAIGVRAAVADQLCRAPNRAELTAARRAAHDVAASGRARVLYVPGADADANAGELQLFGAGEAEYDHERHPTLRAGSRWE